MATSATLLCTRGPDHRVVVRLAGRWSVRVPVGDAAVVLRALTEPSVAGVSYDCSELVAWDSSIFGVVAQIAREAARLEIAVDASGLPEGARRLLALVERPQHSQPPPHRAPLGILARVGIATSELGGQVEAALGFVGAVTRALGLAMVGRAHLRGRDVVTQLQRTGVEGLPIVALISFLVGVILAFVGSLQLGRFGASSYVADLVGLAMVREVGALMTAIVVAGRTGAAFAAELATMRVTQELDALEVVDLPPIELLVVPRLIALAAMVPLLSAYGSLIGIAGGSMVAVLALGVAPSDYLAHTVAILGGGDVVGGLVKAFTYGIVVAGAGCAAGLRAKAGAAAVGEAATRAVVTGMALVIAVCGAYAVLFSRLGV